MLKKVSIAVMFMTLAVGSFLTVSAADSTLAVVNGEPVFESDFILNQALTQYKQVAPPADQTDAKINDFRKSILEQRIDQILVLQQAKKQNVKVTSKQLRDRIAQIKTSFPSEAAFRDYLKTVNLTNAAFEKNVSDQLTLELFTNQLATGKVEPPTEAQVRTLYDNIQLKAKGSKTNLSTEDDQFVQNVVTQLQRITKPRVNWKVILVAEPKGASSEVSKIAKDKIKLIKDSLRKGGDFSQVAAQYSDDEASRQRGGDMGVVVKGDLATQYPEVDKVLFNLPVGKYSSDPIKTDVGYFFVKVEQKEAGKNIKDIKFDEIKEQLAMLYYQNEASKVINAWLNDLKNKSTIKRNI